MAKEKKVKVTLAISRSGPGGTQARGDVIEVTPAEAKRMAAAGQLMDAGEPVETATAKE